MHTKDNLSLIQIQGPEAEKFLQGQLTCDLTQSSDKQLMLGAHCNIKGRIESLFQIFKQDSSFYLLLPRSIASHALATLKKYSIFSKNLELTLLDFDSTLVPVTLPEGFDAWRLAQIQQGLPTLFPETIGKFLPHDLNLPQLGAVSFNKGCYLGQEIVARMQHLGKPKRHMIQAQISGKPGDEREDGSVIVDAVGEMALVVTNINKP